jgi:hypothetical protein
VSSKRRLRSAIAALSKLGVNGVMGDSMERSHSTKQDPQLIFR